MANETTNQIATQDKTAIKADIEKMEAAVTDLEAKGADLFSEEIKNLKQKIENAKTELEAETNETITVTETTVSSWWADHKADIFNVAKIAALVYIAMRLTM
ncbi:hypothetical protein [Pectinatus frisingensis]|uniref:hypothetical protein n=1 Tax=Pectinatus frisingensis TaxID=865 RepID=UPI0018C57F07|nr:hypothetical protein [Pectinatus frisingensis]